MTVTSVCQRCAVCGLMTFKKHEQLTDCIAALKARLDEPEPCFSLSGRRLRFITHPDVDRGQYVLIAGHGTGKTMWTKAAHELSLCIDEQARQQLIELLRGKPEEVG